MSEAVKSITLEELIKSRMDAGSMHMVVQTNKFGDQILTVWDPKSRKTEYYLRQFGRVILLESVVEGCLDVAKAAFKRELEEKSQ